MAENDRIDPREKIESPFKTLARQVAGIKVQDGTHILDDNEANGLRSTEGIEEEDEPRVVDSIDSLCMNCEENVSSFVFTQKRR